MVTDLADIARVLSLISLGVASGMLARFYATRRRQPDARLPAGALLGVLLWAFALAGALVYRIGLEPSDFQWWMAPPVLLGSAAIVAALWQQMEIKH